ncbi:unnamed protein product, partial [Laminaria digitata]
RASPVGRRDRVQTILPANRWCWTIKRGDFLSQGHQDFAGDGLRRLHPARSPA